MSGREYTLEELNYFRVCYITIKVIRDGLQTVFKREWDRVHGSTLGLWQDTAKNGNDFFNLESRSSRRKNNRLLGIIRNSNTSEWDSTSFFFAILFSDSLGGLVTPTVATNVDTLRVFRNGFFAHRSQASISDTDFQANLKLIWNAFTALHLDTKELHEISSQGSFPTGELQLLQENIRVLEEELQAKPESFKCLPPEPSHEVNERKSKVDEILQIFKNLEKNDDGSIVTVYLHGNPGCGKSQIAREIGKTFYKEAVPDGTEVDNFAFVMTLNAESEQSLLESFCKFARKLGVTEYSLNSITGGDSKLKPDEKISHLKTLISAKVKDYFTWLVIFDNANDLESLKGCWPDEDWGGCGKVLVTTQDSINLPFGESSFEDISLSDGMQVEDALTLLRSISRFSCDDENLERLVIEELDFQPLAIACAALYVRHVRTVPGGFTWKDYLCKLEMGKRHETDKIYERQSRSYPSSMTSAVTIAVQTLVQNELFKYVVHFLGLGASEPIDLDIIVSLVKKQEPDLDEDVAAADIAQCSLLIRFDEDDGAKSVIRIHQVVHDAFRRHLLANCSTKEITALSKIYIETLAPFAQHNFLQIDLEFHMFSKVIAPHLKLFSTYLKTSSSWISPDVTCDERKQLKNAFLNFGDICNIHGHLSAAIKYLEHALDIANEEGDDGETRIKFIATILNNLGIVYCKQGKLREAKDHHERALSLLKSLTNQNPTPEIADSLNKLGNACYKLGDFGEAKNWFCQSLAMREDFYGRYHTTVAASLNNLGCVSGALGEHDIAKDYYQRSLAIEEQVNGKFHPRVADCLCNLGIVYSELGSTGKAIQYHEQALKMRKELYFPDHFLISESCNNLGLMLKSMGQLEQAMNYYDAALRIRKKVLHDEHPAVAEILNNLGQLYMEMGELEKSKEFHYQALNIRRESLGSDHCKVGDTMLNLGLVREQCFELDDEVFYFKRALEIYSKSYPMSHPLCQTANECLQRVSQQQEDLRAHDLRSARFVLSSTRIPRAVRRSRILNAFFGSHWGIRVQHTSANTLQTLDLDLIISCFLSYLLLKFVENYVGEAQKGRLKTIWLTIPHFVYLQFLLRSITGETINAQDVKWFLFWLFLFILGYFLQSCF